MMVRWWLMVLSIFLMCVQPIAAQQAPNPTCEAQLQELTSQLSTRYHELYSDKLVVTERPATTPTVQLQSLVQQLRFYHTRYQLAKDDENRHESTVAQLNGMLGDLQRQVQDLRQQVSTKDAQLTALRKQGSEGQPHQAAGEDKKE